jgi:hypothetical protein
MKEYADLINQVGVPVGGLIFLAWGAVGVFKWLGQRLDQVGAFLAPLFTRLIEATEANVRFMEGVTHQLANVNELHRWHHDTVAETLDVAKAMAAEAATNTRELLRRLEVLETRQDRTEQRELDRVERRESA